MQIPGYLAAQDELKAAGIEEVMVFCVNDGAVMTAWRGPASMVLPRRAPRLFRGSRGARWDNPAPSTRAERPRSFGARRGRSREAAFYKSAPRRQSTPWGRVE